MFAALLDPGDARRATGVIDVILAHGLQCALTGGLAIAAQLRVRGRSVTARSLNDIDLVVSDFESIPTSLAEAFLLNHVHPFAPEGKTLLQVIDQPRALRVDLFRAFGDTLSRAELLDEDTGGLPVLSIEDLVARTTAMVCGNLQRGTTIDFKHVAAFQRLRGLGEPRRLAIAWRDHQQEVHGTIEEAAEEAGRLLSVHPELIVVERYSTLVTQCERCLDFGAFHVTPPHRIVEVLGYW